MLKGKAEIIQAPLCWGEGFSIRTGPVPSQVQPLPRIMQMSIIILSHPVTQGGSCGMIAGRSHPTGFTKDRFLLSPRE